MKSKIFFSALVIVTLVLSACASATPTATAMPASTIAPVIPITGPSTATMAPVAIAMPMATATMAPMATPTSAAMVNLGQNATLGSFLVDSKGMTLYSFAMDAPGENTCYGACATAWPPLLTNGAPITGTGLDATMMGTTTRKDGTVQVTYNGLPLYYFSKDITVGDTMDEGVKSLWFVVMPDGLQK